MYDYPGFLAFTAGNYGLPVLESCCIAFSPELVFRIGVRPPVLDTTSLETSLSLLSVFSFFPWGEGRKWLTAPALQS